MIISFIVTKIVLFLFMQKLAQINLKNTVSVKIDSIVNQDVIIKNFQIIMECLKDLKDGQDGLSNNF